MENQIEIQNFTMSYQQKKHATNIFRDFNFAIKKNEKIALLGQSGSGKTTIAKLLMDLLPENASIESGTLVFDEENIKLKEKGIALKKFRGKKIGIIHQDAQEALNPTMTIYEHFKELLLYHKIAKKGDIESIATKFLTRLLFNEPLTILKSYPFELSGGMCQRVCIALVLALNPSIIIADEITSALDIISSVEVLNSLKKLDDKTVFLITHDISAAFYLATRIAIINKGQICDIGSVKDIAEHGTNIYTLDLVASYRKIRNLSYTNTTKKDETILEVKNLSKSYVKGKKVINDLSFSVQQGEIFGILGVSGSGKSTLCRSIIGLEKVDQGEIIYKEQDILRLKGRTRRAISVDIQLIFQEARAALNPNHEVLDLVQEIFLYNHLYDKEKRLQLGKEALSLVGLDEELWHKKPLQLSTGQCQRVGIARAIVAKPKILLCDEIVSALDVKTALQILELIIELKSKLDLTLIMITHDFSILRNISDKIAFMQNGIFEEIFDRVNNMSKSKNEDIKKFLKTYHTLENNYVLQTSDV